MGEEPKTRATVYGYDVGYETFPGLPGAPAARALKPRLRYKLNHGVVGRSE